MPYAIATSICHGHPVCAYGYVESFMCTAGLGMALSRAFSGLADIPYGDENRMDLPGAFGSVLVGTYEGYIEHSQQFSRSPQSMISRFGSILLPNCRLQVPT